MKKPNPRAAMKHVINLGMLTMQIVKDYEEDGGASKEFVEFILDAVSGLYAQIGKELGIRDEVDSLFKEVKEEVRSFNALPSEIKEMLIEYGHGVGDA
jgi:hypothetical protein